MDLILDYFKRHPNTLAISDMGKIFASRPQHPNAVTNKTWADKSPSVWFKTGFKAGRKNRPSKLLPTTERSGYAVWNGPLDMPWYLMGYLIGYGAKDIQGENVQASKGSILFTLTVQD